MNCCAIIVRAVVRVKGRCAYEAESAAIGIIGSLYWCQERVGRRLPSTWV